MKIEFSNRTTVAIALYRQTKEQRELFMRSVLQCKEDPARVVYAVNKSGEHHQIASHFKTWHFDFANHTGVLIFEGHLNGK